MKRTRQAMVPWLLAAGTGMLIAATTVWGPVLAASGDELVAELKQVPYRIVYETYHDGNWELFMAGADGSHPVNLTQTPDVDELYPHVSPDGTKVCFIVDEGVGAAKVRSVYTMNLDGTGRTLVARNACWPCWKSDGTAIAYLRSESDEFTYRDYATKGLVIYDLKTGKHREHPNQGLHHLYNICWSPDGNWFLATVHAGMGYRHAILAIQANGTKVYDLKLGGCRPDISPDGKHVAWGSSDWTMALADLDLTGPQPKATNRRNVVTSPKPMMIYHMDWSPDSKYIAFSRGPGTKRLGQHPAIIGIKAAGWNLCVADAAATNRWTTITTDGKCNKEPDWAPVLAASADELVDELKQVPYRIVYETYRDDNWELFMVGADGSHPVNLTQTSDVDELYPHVSPDGSRICFVADEGEGTGKVRNVYTMNLNGTGRTLVARNARQPFWNPDGTVIAYMKGASEKFTYSSIATKGLFFYDLATGKHTQHPNNELSHLFGACWSPCGKWIVTTVHGGMGYRHAILAIEADGRKVFNLGIPGCRPEVSPDGKRIAWTPSDWALRVADLDLTGPEPKVTGGRDVVTSSKPTKVYHIDWPPDGKFVVFTRGPATKRLGRAPEGVGVRAEGWNICVADVTQTNRWVAITTDGHCNKEPDWAPLKGAKATDSRSK